MTERVLVPVADKPTKAQLVTATLSKSLERGIECGSAAGLVLKPKRKSASFSAAASIVIASDAANLLFS